MAQPIFRRACCNQTSDTRSAKTVPCKQSVCHNSNGASACRLIQAKRKVAKRDQEERPASPDEEPGEDARRAPLSNRGRAHPCGNLRRQERSFASLERGVDGQFPNSRPPGRWPGQSMHARCREQSADAAVSYPRTTFDCRLLSIRRLRFPWFFVVQLQNFLRAD